MSQQILGSSSSLQVSDLELGMRVDAGGLRKPIFRVLKVKTRSILSNRKLPIAH